MILIFPLVSGEVEASLEVKLKKEQEKNGFLGYLIFGIEDLEN